MSKAVTAHVSPPIAIPVRELLPWLVFGGLLMLLGFTHDGRHLLGFPCH
jgi:hypothetical protein